MPNSITRAKSALVVLLLLALALSAVAAPLADSSTTGENTQLTSASISLGQSVGVFAPSPSNMTLLAVAGGEYDVRLQHVAPFSGLPTTAQSAAGHAMGNEIIFVPGNTSAYTVGINVTSRGPTYALVTEGAVPPENLLKNVTSGGSFVLTIVITVAPSAAKGGGYSFLFGFTGLSLGQVGFSTLDFLLFFTSLAIILVGFGAWLNRKLLGLGLLLLFGIGTILIGVLFAILILGLYSVSFVAVHSYFSLRPRKPKRETGGSPWQ